MTVSAELYPWLSVGAIAWGLLDCFLGYRVFKVTLGIFGGLLGAFLGQSFAAALSFGPGGQIAAIVIGGLAGAGLAFMLYLGAVFVAGFGFGSTLGVLLLAHYNQMVALMSGIVMGIIGGFLAVKLQEVLIILSTSLLGSFRTILAVSYFANRLDWVFYFKNPQQIPAVIDGNGWMFPAILILAVAGVITQFELGGSSAKKKSKPRDK